MNRLRLTAVVAVGAAAIVGTAVQLRPIDAANGAQESLPPGKQAILDAEASFRTGGNRADKGKDPGGPLIIQEDPPPVTGLLGPVQAPMFGGVFTTSNAWAGWVNPTTYVIVYAGAPSGSPSNGEIFVETRSGRDGRLDPDAGPIGTLISAPRQGGPLRIVRVEAGEVIVVNPAGKEFRFNPLTRAFD